MPRLLVVVPGFGPGSIELKKRLLKKNIEIIRNTYSGSVTVYVFNYGTEPCECPDVTEVFEKGYIGQFLYKHITPNLVDNFDNVIVLLDDIEIHEDTNINTILLNLTSYNFDILSPSLTHHSQFSHSSMLQQKAHTDKIRVQAHVELFFYVMSASSYKKWYSLLDERSAWLWGIDLVLHKMGFHMGILDNIPMTHHIKGSAKPEGAPCPTEEMNHTLARFGGTRSSFNYVCLTVFNFVPLLS